MNNSTSNSDKNKTDKKMTKLKKTSLQLKIILTILIVLVFAMVITVCVLFAIFLNKANSSNEKNNSNSAKNTTSSNYANTTTNFNSNRNCKNYTVGKYCDECGLTFSDSNLKIIGGQEANANSWPSIGYIVYNYKQKFYFTEKGVFLTRYFTGFCSGTLIDRTTFLSAAQCVVPKVSFDYDYDTYYQSITIVPNEYYPTYETIFSVFLGVHDASVIDKQDLDNDISPAKRYKVFNVITHEEYDSNTNLNDIAIFKLSEEAELNAYVQLACLPSKQASYFPAVNTKLYAAGWGQLAYRGENSDTLQNVEINVYDGPACHRYPNTNWNLQICAGESIGGKGTCFGDTGGPLYLKETINGTVRHVLVGITSDGFCGYPDYPGIYTRVSYFLDWINNNK